MLPRTIIPSLFPSCVMPSLPCLMPFAVPSVSNLLVLLCLCYGIPSLWILNLCIASISRTLSVMSPVSSRADICAARTPTTG